MNLVFMGTPDFAVPCLEKLAQSGHNVLAAFSQPDKPKGRGHHLMPTAVKQCAERYGIPVYQPATMRDGTAFALLKKLNPDAIIVAAYGKILPAEIIHLPPYGCMNVHGSLLPKYRGAAPIQWAVLDGEKETGVTIMQMDEGLDTGDMLYTAKTEIGENETAPELFERLSLLGADTLLKALDLLEKGELKPVKQEASQSTYAKMIDKAMCPIDWSRPAAEIHNQIRGLAGWPVAITKWNGKNLKVHLSCLSDERGQNSGEVLQNNKRLVVSCGNETAIELLEIQLEGKKKMKASDFLLGNPIQLGEILGI